MFTGTATEVAILVNHRRLMKQGVGLEDILVLVHHPKETTAAAGDIGMTQDLMAIPTHDGRRQDEFGPANNAALQKKSAPYPDNIWIRNFI